MHEKLCDDQRNVSDQMDPRSSRGRSQLDAKVWKTPKEACDQTIVEKVQFIQKTDQES